MRIRAHRVTSRHCLKRNIPTRNSASGLQTPCTVDRTASVHKNAVVYKNSVALFPTAALLS